MGWENKLPYVHPQYNCRKPTWDKSFGVGSRWRCDECGRLYRFDGRQGDQRDTYDKWTEISGPTTSHTGLGGYGGSQWDR